MKKTTLMQAMAVTLMAGVFAYALPVFADDLTTSDPAGMPSGDSATNYSDSNGNTASTPSASDEEEQSSETGITPDIATGEDDY